jgi:hypothetical protein
MKLIPSLVLAMTLTLSAAAFAEMKKPSQASMTPPTKEQREKMAVLHDKMATCLRSDKAMPECQKEMRESCELSMGKDGCPMMRRHHAEVWESGKHSEEKAGEKAGEKAKENY